MTLCNDLRVLSRFSLADLSSKNSLTIAVIQGTIPFVSRSVEAILALYIVRCTWMQQHFLRFLPDPVLGEDGRYLPFNVFGKPTIEKDRPSLKAKKQVTFI